MHVKYVFHNCGFIISEKQILITLLHNLYLPFMFKVNSKNVRLLPLNCISIFFNNQNLRVSFHEIFFCFSAFKLIFNKVVSLYFTKYKFHRRYLMSTDSEIFITVAERYFLFSFRFCNS